MTFDHDFGHSLPLFSSLLKKEGRRKWEWIAKIAIKSHAFLLDPVYNTTSILSLSLPLSLSLCAYLFFYLYDSLSHNFSLLLSLSLFPLPLSLSLEFFVNILRKLLSWNWGTFFNRTPVLSNILHKKCQVLAPKKLTQFRNNFLPSYCVCMDVFVLIYMYFLCHILLMQYLPCNGALTSIVW